MRALFSIPYMFPPFLGAMAWKLLLGGRAGYLNKWLRPTFGFILNINSVWGMESEATDNNVEVYISFLRKKLKFLKSRVGIKNLQKIGYRLEVEPC